MEDEMKFCKNCKHYEKTMIEDPCRNCLYQVEPRLPFWKPAEVEQTPAARIAELEAEVERLIIAANDTLLFFAVLLQSIGGEVKISQNAVMNFGKFKIQKEDDNSDMSYTFRLAIFPQRPTK
jgi:hypothetical protein